MLSKLYPAIIFAFLLSCSKKANDDNNSPDIPNRDGIYTNGYLSTGTTTYSGTSAPAGYQWSEAQYVPGETVSNSVIGYACYYNSYFNYKAADDFMVPAGQTWALSKISVYVNGDNVATCPFDVLRIEIWNGNPKTAGSSVIFGNMSTNVLAETKDSMMYAILNTQIPTATNNPTLNYKIWKLSANINKTLPPGSYWLVYQAHCSNDNECYSPPIKIKGSRGLPGWNAKVFNSLGVWQEIVDTGIPSTSARVPQDLPFEIIYKY
ncbi:MAG TPA: hypothetical protein PKA77_13910 [Chitinophagaceae bacterium]|jgi:hypothetical protein|nr:hypothetical protein [Chitinophagaceae bacterium]HMU58080.1 hypothetical protein [Chitinophagaceae bacterium]